MTLTLDGVGTTHGSPCHVWTLMRVFANVSQTLTLVQSFVDND